MIEIQTERFVWQLVTPKNWFSSEKLAKDRGSDGHPFDLLDRQEMNQKIQAMYGSYYELRTMQTKRNKVKITIIRTKGTNETCN